jgi:hypothetical protein
MFTEAKRQKAGETRTMRNCETNWSETYANETFVCIRSDVRASGRLVLGARIDDSRFMVVIYLVEGLLEGREETRRKREAEQLSEKSK